MILERRGALLPPARLFIIPQTIVTFPQRDNFLFSPQEAEQMKQNLVQLAATGVQDAQTSALSPPSYLIHQLQVLTVADALLETLPICRATGNIVAATHDLGRSVDNNSHHVPYGYDLALQLGLPKEVANIALLHHQWGLGVDPFGTAHFNTFADLEEMSGQTMLQNPQMIMNEWRGALGTEDENIFYAAMATLIADGSKSKEFVEVNGKKVPMSKIDVFDAKLGHALIHGQLGKSYEKESPGYWNDFAGMYFLLNMIEYFERTTGVSYSNAVKKAQKTWNTASENELLRQWKNEYSHAQFEGGAHTH